MKAGEDVLGQVRRQRQGNTKQRGFTLIELLIVVAIIAVLAAIAIPVFKTYSMRANNVTAETDLRQFRTVLEAYYYDYQVYP